MTISKDSRKFYLRCQYLEPVIREMNIAEIWQEKVVSFEQLTIDVKNHRAFFFDYALEVEKIQKELLLHKKEQDQKKFREVFIKFWWRYHKYGWDEVEGDYIQLIYLLKKYDIDIPEKPSKNLVRFSTLVLTAQEGEPIASGYSTLLEVANWGYDNGKQVLYYFYKVLSHCHRWNELILLDDMAAKKKQFKIPKRVGWREKKEFIREKIMANDPEYVRDKDLIPLFRFLYPTIVVKTESTGPD